ncbi:MAG: hypothetical protein KDD50_10930 [Bdellovibrionales bacterium]|nr:hypothetical protein [Bdellovibrionales bacterium]
MSTKKLVFGFFVIVFLGILLYEFSVSHLFSSSGLNKQKESCVGEGTCLDADDFVCKTEESLQSSCTQSKSKKDHKDVDSIEENIQTKIKQ